MDIFVILLFLLGFVLIIKGGDWFIESAVWIANITGIPKVIIGATIVSLATTLPELLVSVFAVTKGSTGLSIGNAIGSIICNTGLILSLALIVRPPKLDRRFFLSKCAILIVSVISLAIVAFNGSIIKIESLVLFALLVVYIVFNLKTLRRNNTSDENEEFEDNTEIRHIDTSRKSILINTARFIAGAAGIIFGANLLVDNGIIIASALGVSDAVIGLTVVAIGTSLPELVTTITSLVKKHGAMGVGNIIGANILNVTFVLSTSAAIGKDGLVLAKEQIAPNLLAYRTLAIDIPVVLFMLAILVLPVLFNKKGKLMRFQGVLLMITYVSFIIFTAL